jgi:hypothetical protein
MAMGSEGKRRATKQRASSEQVRSRKARMAGTRGRSFIVVVLKPCSEERNTTFIGWLLNVQVILLDLQNYEATGYLLEYYNIFLSICAFNPCQQKKWGTSTTSWGRQAMRRQHCWPWSRGEREEKGMVRTMQGAS